MNILKKIIYAVPVVAVMLATSCAKDSTATPEGGDVADCYNVYFPEQDNMGSIELTAEESLPKTFTYTACRTNENDDITVPVVVANNTDDVFVVSPIHFADGEKSTTFTVTLTDKAALGVEYSLKLNIEDTKYAPRFSSLNPTKYNPQLAVEVMRAHWVDVSTGGTYSCVLTEEKISGLKMQQKEKTNDYKIVNFIGMGTDLVFTWDPDTNKCDIKRQPSGITISGHALDVMDFRNFYLEYFGETYDWEIFENAGYQQSSYDPDKKLFVFNLMYMDISTGFGTNPLADRFVFKGGSFGCELELIMFDPSRLVDTDSVIDSGTIQAWPNSEYMGWQIQAPSNNIKSLQFIIIPTLAYDYPESELGMSLDQYLQQNGISGTTQIDSAGTTILDRLNDPNRGFFLNLSEGLDPGTSYTMYAKATNTLDETDEFVYEHTTGAAGIYYKMSYAAEGESEASYEVTFRLEENILNDDAETPIYYVKNLGVEDGQFWHAAYNATTNLLTIPGYMVNAEESGCIFNQYIAALNPEKTMAYKLLSIDPDNTESKGTDACVFEITDGYITSLNTTLAVRVDDISGTAPVALGYLGYYPAGTAVEQTTAPEDGDEEESASVNVNGVKVSFSSLSNMAFVKEHNSMMAAGSKLLSVKKQVEHTALKPIADMKKIDYRKKL